MPVGLGVPAGHPLRCSIWNTCEVPADGVNPNFHHVADATEGPAPLPKRAHQFVALRPRRCRWNRLAARTKATTFLVVEAQVRRALWRCRLRMTLATREKDGEKLKLRGETADEVR